MESAELISKPLSDLTKKTVFVLALGLLLSGDFLRPVICKADLVDFLEVPAPIPAREIIQNNSSATAWKKTWDEARQLVRKGEYQAAEKKYDELLLVKGSLEEARWESGRLLLRTGNWEKAVEVLELLIEAAPDRVDYLNGLGLALRKLGHFSRALDLFAKAHNQAPDNLVSLAGLAQGLVEIGRKKEAFPLIETFLDRKPEDLEVRRSLANLAFELGKLETARKLMVSLASGGDADLDTLIMTARVHERLGWEKTAARYWERCLERDNGNREALGRLALYHEKRGQIDKALPYLLALLEKNPQNSSLLSRICRIYVQNDHFAEALPYFERYVQLKPDDLDLLKSIVNIKPGASNDTISLYRRLLAITPDDLSLLDSLTTDLLATGDAEGALFLWEHVVRLVPERIEAYQEIVELLEKLGRNERLAEVLEVMHKLAPGEMQIISKLARLKVAQGDLQAGLEYYNKLQKAGYKGEELFEGRGELYSQLEQPTAAFKDFMSLLSLSPGRQDIRRLCVVLAGKLGEIDSLKRIAADLEITTSPAERNRDMMLIAEAFGTARDFGRSHRIYKWLLSAQDEHGAGTSAVGDRDRFEQSLRLALAELYLKEGLIYEAQQVLRESLQLQTDQRPVLLFLFDLALVYDNDGIQNARVWMDRYASLPGGGSGEIAIMHARVSAATGDYGRAAQLLRKFLADTVSTTELAYGQSTSGRLIRKAGFLLIDVLMEDDELAEAEQQCLAMLGGEFDTEVLVALQKIYYLAGENEAAVNISRQLLGSVGDNINLLELAELYSKYGLVSGQAEIARKVLEGDQISLRASMSLAQSLMLMNKTGEAIQLLGKMQDDYNDNTSVVARLAKYYLLNGQYDLACQYSDMLLEMDPDRMDGSYIRVQCELAKGKKHTAKAIVADLFEVRTRDILAKRISKAGIKLGGNTPRRTLWQVLTFSSALKSDIANELMAAASVADNTNPEQKAINSITGELYARYRWENKFFEVVPFNRK